MERQLMTFAQSLQVGQLGESIIARWFRNRGFSVLPVYEVEIDAGKGPRLFAPTEQLIAPDILAFKGDNTYWIEAKHKTHFSWHNKTRQWVTGIDLRHYEDYCKLHDSTPWPVWLLFLHKDAKPWDQDKDKWNCPAECPVGLFGQTIQVLREKENHRHENWGKDGMVYWAHTTLLPLATLKEIEGL
jgi:hypothetical protein